MVLWQLYGNNGPLGWSAARKRSSRLRRQSDVDGGYEEAGSFDDEGGTKSGDRHGREAKKTATAAAAEIEQTMCPVMDGNKIDKNVFVEYKGKKVYFCCTDARRSLRQTRKNTLPICRSSQSKSGIAAKGSRTMKMKALTVSVVILAAGIGVFAAGRHFITRQGMAASKTAKDLYYCPMHPNFTSDKPGECAICGMSLVKRVTASAGRTENGVGQIEENTVLSQPDEPGGYFACPDEGPDGNGLCAGI